MWRAIIPLIVLAPLGACTAANFDCISPHVRHYSTDELERAAIELEALPEGSVLPQFMADYGLMRAQARVCTGKMGAF